MCIRDRTIDDQNYCGKKVLVRCDFNVPMKDGVITNENRINAAPVSYTHLLVLATAVTRSVNGVQMTTSQVASFTAGISSSTRTAASEAV